MVVRTRIGVPSPAFRSRVLVKCWQRNRRELAVALSWTLMSTPRPRSCVIVLPNVVDVTLIVLVPEPAILTPSARLAVMRLWRVRPCRPCRDIRDAAGPGEADPVDRVSSDGHVLDQAVHHAAVGRLED